MDARNGINTIREKYLTFFRDTLTRLRADAGEAQPEVLIRPNVAPNTPGDKVLICDIIAGSKDDPKMHLLMGEELAPGPTIGELDVDGHRVAVFAMYWESLPFWFRHAEPDFEVVAKWLAQWREQENRVADEDGLHGIVHYVSPPVKEGGGHLLELDMGSAPVEALIDLIRRVIAMGASEIQLGVSDGSHLDPQLIAKIRSPELSPASFCEVMAALLRQFPETAEVKIKAQDTLTLPGKNGDQICYLGNIYRKLMRIGPEARVFEVYGFLRGQRDMLNIFDDTPDLSQLRPVIKDDRFFEALLDHMRENAKSPAELEKGFPIIRKALAADLNVSYVWDSARSMRFVQTEELEKYGLTLEECHARAMQNFVESQRDPQITNDGPIRVVSTRDSYEASLLLDDGFWQDIAPQVKGRLLACAPARDFLLFTGADEPGGIAALIAAADRISASGNHLISQSIVERVGSQWQAYAMPPRAGAVLTFNPPAAPAKAARKRPWWKFW